MFNAAQYIANDAEQIIGYGDNREPLDNLLKP